MLSYGDVLINSKNISHKQAVRVANDLLMEPRGFELGKRQVLAAKRWGVWVVFELNSHGFINGTKQMFLDGYFDVLLKVQFDLTWRGPFNGSH